MGGRVSELGRSLHEKKTKTKSPKKRKLRSIFFV